MPDQDEPRQQSGLTERGRRRLTTVIVLSVLTLLLMLSLVAQYGFNLSPLVSPDSAGATLLLYALSSLNFLAFVTLFFVLLRNVVKLVRERRAGRLGSKFKARLVSYAIGLSLLPVLLLFFFAFGLLNRSIDRWFGEPTRQIVDDARIIEDNLFKKDGVELTGIARAVARSLSLASREDFESPEFEGEVRREMSDYNLALTRIGRGDRTLTVESGGRAVEPNIEETLGAAQRELRAGSESFTGSDDGESPSIIYIISGIRVGPPADPRMLVVAREFPPELTRQAASIHERFNNIDNLRYSIKGIKDRYILLLSLVALLLIFAAVWLALYVARGITVPIQALAEATDRVAHGDFSRRVEVEAEDELVVLVNSFNQMASQLAGNRKQLELAAEDLRRSNLALDDRRRYIETVLESLSTGVISTDERTGIATINHAALSILGVRERPAAGTPIDRVIEGPQGQELSALCRRARRVETAQADIEFTRADGSGIHTVTTAIALRSSEGGLAGWVIVIEDLTDLVRAERASAWSEVARRMAHEIKNPLTPIQLSAERIIRNYNRGAGPGEPRFEEIIRDGTATIIREVGALQRMVEEFSTFARLPETRPVPSSLGDVVRDAVKLYAERTQGIRIDCRLSDEIPPLLLDPEQIKRALVNLIDNAIEALTTNGEAEPGAERRRAGSPERLIQIESFYSKVSDAVRLVVSDTGHGIRPSDRDKLFLPKFSTRDRGTGLGLAIVSQIVSNHGGRIWVEDNQPRGARFTIEFPVG